MEQIQLFLSNDIVRISFVGWFAAQVIKVFLNLIVNKELKLERFVGSGGMPSSHTSLVVSMVTAVARVEGVDSTIFAVGLVFAMIVMYDAMGVRREAGQQAKLINWMMENWEEGDDQMFGKKLKELIGHTPLEVIAGAILGLVIGLVMDVG